MTDGHHRPRLSIAPGQPVYRALVRQGVAWPDPCRSGACGLCRVRLDSGAVRHLGHAPASLSARDRADGIVLACRASTLAPTTVRPLDTTPAARHPIRRLTGRIAAIQAPTELVRIVTVQLDADTALDFSPGQFLSARFAGLPARDYSIADAIANVPAATAGGRITFHIARSASGTVTVHVHDRLAVGDPVVLTGPYGSAHLRGGCPRPVVAVAGGTGLAPILAIVQAALADRPERPVLLGVGAANAAALYAAERLRELDRRHAALRLVVALDDETGPIGAAVGHALGGWPADGADPASCRAYLAGPPAMVEDGLMRLVTAGLARERIHADPFYSDAQLARFDQDAPFDVTPAGPRDGR